MLVLPTTTRAADWIVSGSIPADLRASEVVIVTTPDLNRHLFRPGDDVLLRSPVPLRSLLVTAEGYQARRIRCQYQPDTHRFALGRLAMTRKEAVVSLSAMTVTDQHPTAVSIPVANAKPRDLLGQAGSDGSLAKALQRLPGVTTPDQGSGLFIRGGNSNETLVVVNGTSLSSPDRELAPLGNITSMVNAESVESVRLQTANISARYGNVLSGVVDLNTDRVVDHDQYDFGLSMAGATADLEDRIGRLTAGFDSSYDTTRVLESNYGRGEPFSTYPWTAENDLSLAFDSGPVRSSLFVLARQSALGIAYATPFFEGLYTERQERRFVSSQTSVTVGAGDTLKVQVGDDWNAKATGFGGASGNGRTRNDELHLSYRHVISDTAHIEGGVDYGISRFTGSNLFAGGSGAVAPTTADAQSRRGVYAEGALETKNGWMAAIGMRAAEDTYARSVYLSPRISVRRKFGDWSAYATAGTFYQALDPERASQLADPAWLETAHMRTVSAGVAYTAKHSLVSIETYHKSYGGLVDYTADRRSLEGGIGQTVTGIDLAAARGLWQGAMLRGTLGLLRTLRNNPHDGTYPADTDIPITFDLRLSQDLFSKTFHAEVAYGYWSGAPFTRFTGVNESDGELYYAARNGDRFPSRTHVSFSLYNIFRLRAHCYLIPEVSGDNLLNRLDAETARYGPDWNIAGYDGTNLKRSFFFGFVISYE